MKTQKSSGILVLAILALIGTSCKEEVTKATVKASVTPNDLLAPSASSYVLTLADKDKVFETFKWTAPDFGFTSSTTYKVQMVKSDGTFTATSMEVASVNNLLQASITVGAMNDKLLGMGLAPQSASSIKLRVVSTISDKVAPVNSSEKTISVTPYATTFPSIWGMGDGLNGWGPWPTASVEWASNSFKKYETQARLVNGATFRFFEQQDWGPTSYNYPFFTTHDSDLVNANDGDSNFRVAAATGWYTVTLDLVAKSIVVTPTTEPTLFITGDAQGAWGWGAGQYIKMKFIKPGVFEATPTFNTTGAFRFFAQADWSPTHYNYPYFTTVDNKFINANDGDKNFRFLGPAGPYKVIVDLTGKTVKH